jgi:hypothetical protein
MTVPLFYQKAAFFASAAWALRTKLDENERNCSEK